MQNGSIKHCTVVAVLFEDILKKVYLLTNSNKHVNKVSSLVPGLFLGEGGEPAVADLEIWKGGFKVVGVAQKAAEDGRQRRITRAAEQPKYVLKM